MLNKKMIIFILCITVCLMSIGYATFYTYFNIEGHATIKENWGVRISEADSSCKIYSELYSIQYEEIPCDGDGIEPDMCADLNIVSELDVGVYAKLQQPGDIVVCEIYYENYGTLDAKLTHDIRIVKGSSVVQLLDEGEVYDDGVFLYEAFYWGDDILTARTKNYMYIAVSYNSDVTTQPDSNRLKLSFEIKTKVSQIVEH